MLKLLFYALVAFLSLGQFSKIAATVYIFDIAAAIFGIFGCFYFLVTKKITIHKNLLLYFVFLLVALVSLAIQLPTLPMQEAIGATLYIVRVLVYILSALTVYLMVSTKSITSSHIVRAFCASGVFIALAGFIQLLVLPDFSVLDPSLGWDPHKNRLASTFFDPNFTGGYLALVFWLVFLNKNYLKPKNAITSLVFIGAALFLTYSRSAWGMFAVMVFWYGLAKNPKILLLSLVLAFSAYFAIPRIQTRFSGLTDPADSASLRFISWKNAYAIAIDNPLTGVGFNAFKNAQLEYGFLTPDTLSVHHGTGADSSMLLVLATTGIFGFAVFLAAYFFPLVNKPGVLVGATLAGLLLQSQFINALFFPQILFLWMIILILF